MTEKNLDDKTIPLRVRICMLLGIDPLTGDEALYQAIAAQAAEIERLTKWAQEAAPFVHRALWEGHSMDSRMKCRHPLCKEITALLPPATDPAPAATSIPALSEYAAEQVAKVTAQQRDERQGKR